MTIDHIAIVLSAFSFAISLYTLWAVRVSPFRLIVYPPAVVLLNRAESSLVLDLTFFNYGRTPAAILDMEITLCDAEGKTGSRPLKPKAFHQTPFPHESFKNGPWLISHFSAFTIKKDETVNKTVYFAPSGEPSDGLQPDASVIDTLRIAFKVNNRWNRKCFALNYSEFTEHLQQPEESSLIKPPFAPRFFPDVKPLYLHGSIFDPAF
jgi:hypothetical protein